MATRTRPGAGGSRTSSGTLGSRSARSTRCPTRRRSIRDPKTGPRVPRAASWSGTSPRISTRTACRTSAAAPLRHRRYARRFGVVVYSATPAPDARTASLRAAVESAHGRDAWRDVKDLTELELAELVRADGVDVLVELTGHTANNRLGAMARRPRARAGELDRVPEQHGPRRGGLPHHRSPMRSGGDEADVRGAPRASPRVLPVLRAEPRSARERRPGAVRERRVRHVRVLQRAGEDHPGGQGDVGASPPPRAQQPPPAQGETVRVRDDQGPVPGAHGGAGRGTLARGPRAAEAVDGGAPRDVRIRRRRAGHLPVRGDRRRRARRCTRACPW